MTSHQTKEGICFMRTIELNNRIDAFLERKYRQYPELAEEVRLDRF
jgi:hypothetical protein